MAGVTAKITSPDVTITSLRKGEVGNLIGLKQIIPASGATGATTVSVSGLEITVNLKNTTGTVITATAEEILTAMSGSTDVQGIGTVVLTAAQTGANTGAAFTGTGGIFVRGSSGAEDGGGSTVVYDDLAGATGDGWRKQSGNAQDHVYRTRGANSLHPGTEERQSTLSATGATAAVLAAGRTVDRLGRKSALSPVGL